MGLWFVDMFVFYVVYFVGIYWVWRILEVYKKNEVVL